MPFIFIAIIIKKMFPCIIIHVFIFDLLYCMMSYFVLFFVVIEILVHDYSFLPYEYN